MNKNHVPYLYAFLGKAIVVSCPTFTRVDNALFPSFPVRGRFGTGEDDRLVMTDWCEEFQTASDRNQSMTDLTLNETVHPVRLILLSNALKSRMMSIRIEKYDTFP